MTKSTVSLIVCFLLLIVLASAQNVQELKEKWEDIRSEVSHIPTRERANARSPTVPSGAKAGRGPKTVQLTATLVAWISSQSENIVEEMEAIAKHNAETENFSVVHYLRYLRLYDSLKVIARQPIEQLKWVSKKAKVFSKIYQLALDMVAVYLSDLNNQLTKIELNEPKSKQVGVSAKWLELYESIRYIATHVSITISTTVFIYYRELT